MMRQMSTLIFSAFFATCVGQTVVLAQSLETATVGPDTGAIISSPPSSQNNVKCWVSRSGTGAVAVSIFEDGTTLSAKFRRYSKEEEEYSSKKTKILFPPVPPATSSTTSIELATVPVRLVEIAGQEGTYDMIYDSAAPLASFSVGYVRYVRGNNQRASSDVVVRFKNIEGAIDPCNQPPIDDMGEEEEMPHGLSATAPGPSLPNFAPVSP